MPEEKDRRSSIKSSIVPVNYDGYKFNFIDVPGSDDFSTVVGEVVENKIQKGVLGIKNMSDKVWKVKMPDGSTHEVGSGKGFPLWAGVSADIGGVNIEL
jgi:hypothetical protein